MKHLLMSCILVTIASSIGWADTTTDCAQGKEIELQIAACSVLIEQNPRNATAFYNRGQVYALKAIGEDSVSLMEEMERGRGGGRAVHNKAYDSAFRDLTKAIEINPAYVEAYWVRATVRSARKESQRAIMEDYDKAIKADPGNAEGYYNRGRAYHASGKADQAIADYSKAIEINLKHLKAITHRGAVYLDKGDYERALHDYDKALEVDPQYAFGYAARGDAYAKKGETQRAIADYGKALLLDPMQATAKDGLERLGATR
jgi:tetratricopeptide (TPR) repeat protein